MSFCRGACEDTATRKVLNEPYLSPVMAEIMQQDGSRVTLFRGRSGMEMKRGASCRPSPVKNRLNYLFFFYVGVNMSAIRWTQLVPAAVITPPDSLPPKCACISLFNTLKSDVKLRFFFWPVAAAATSAADL